MKSLATVYVPIDPTEISKNVLPLASLFAEGLGAHLVLIHATDARKSAADLIDFLHLRHEQLKNSIIEPLTGPPGRAISREIELHPNSLIVMPMSSHEHRPSEGLGPLSLEILQTVHCPIVFTPPEKTWEHWRPLHILLPQDSTEECASAISPISTLAQAHASDLRLLHVPSYSKVPLRGNSSLPLPRYLDHFQYELLAWEEEFVERFRQLAEIPETLKLDLRLGMHEPVDEILKSARELPTDLIVIPWYHCDDTSVLRGVLAQAQCPVMALPLRHHRVELSKAA